MPLQTRKIELETAALKAERHFKWGNECSVEKSDLQVIKKHNDCFIGPYFPFVNSLVKTKSYFPFSTVPISIMFTLALLLRLPRFLREQQFIQKEVPLNSMERSMSQEKRPAPLMSEFIQTIYLTIYSIFILPIWQQRPLWEVYITHKK